MCDRQLFPALFLSLRLSLFNFLNITAAWLARHIIVTVSCSCCCCCCLKLSESFPPPDCTWPAKNIVPILNILFSIYVKYHTITGGAIALHCCKDHAKINRKMGSSTPCKIVTTENIICDYVGDIFLRPSKFWLQWGLLPK